MQFRREGAKPRFSYLVRLSASMDRAFFAESTGSTASGLEVISTYCSHEESEKNEGEKGSRDDFDRELKLLAQL